MINPQQPPAKLDRLEISGLVSKVEDAAAAVATLYTTEGVNPMNEECHFLAAINELIEMATSSELDFAQYSSLKKELEEFSLGIEETQYPLQTLINLLRINPEMKISFSLNRLGSYVPINAEFVLKGIENARGSEELLEFSDEALMNKLAKSPYSLTKAFGIRSIVCDSILGKSKSEL